MGSNFNFNVLADIAINTTVSKTAVAKNPNEQIGFSFAALQGIPGTYCFSPILKGPVIDTSVANHAMMKAILTFRDESAYTASTRTRNKEELVVTDKTSNHVDMVLNCSQFSTESAMK